MNVIYVTFFPKDLELDTLYVSDEYHTTAHLCASGCGFRVVLPLSKSGWQLLDDEHATMRPSIHVPSCNAHYFIENGGIRWAKPMSGEYARKYARADQEEYNAENTQQTLLQRAKALLKRLFP